MKESTDLALLCLQSENKQWKCILVVSQWFSAGCSAFRKPSIGWRKWVACSMSEKPMPRIVRSGQASKARCRNWNSSLKPVWHSKLLIFNISFSTFLFFKIFIIGIKLSSLITVWKTAFWLKFLHSFYIDYSLRLIISDVHGLYFQKCLSLHKTDKFAKELLRKRMLMVREHESH